METNLGYYVDFFFKVLTGFVLTDVVTLVKHQTLVHAQKARIFSVSAVAVLFLFQTSMFLALRNFRL